MTTTVQKMIDEYIQTEWYSEPREQTLVSVTGRINAEQVVQLDIMAKDFNKSRSAFVGDLLSAAIQDAFHAYWSAHPEEGKAHLVEKQNHALAALYGEDPEEHHARALSQGFSEEDK